VFSSVLSLGCGGVNPMVRGDCHDQVKQDIQDKYDQRLNRIPVGDPNSTVYKVSNIATKVVLTVAPVGSMVKARLAARAAVQATRLAGEAETASAATKAAEATRSAEAAPTGCKNSFTASTKVLMADGHTKAIKDVKVGDKVLATDPATGKTAAEPVTALHDNQDTDLTDLIVADDHGHTATIHTTTHHPFYNATTHVWTDAGALTFATKLFTPNHLPVHVLAIHTWTSRHDMRNLTIAHLHTYYVAASSGPVLVHNDGGDGPSFDTSRQARLDAMRRAGLPTSLTPKSQTYYSGGYGQAGGYQYVYEYNGGTWLATDNWDDLNADTPHGPHWEVGEAKPGGQQDSLGRLRVNSAKTKAYYGGSCG
jgi:hypothetical protein